jgi:conjugative transfer signal peptidase TraF
MEGTWEKAQERVSVVQQDKGSVVPHRTPPLLLYRLSQFFHHARTIFEYHTVWSPSHRKTRANFAQPHGSDWRRTRYTAPLMAAGAATMGVGLLVLSAHLFRLRITLTDSAAPAGIYRIAQSPAGRGALVAVCLPAVLERQGLARGYLQRGDCRAGAEPVAKIVGAVAGDVVEVEPGGVAVNGVKFANSQTAERDSADRPLAHVLSGAYRVGPGEVWLFGFNDTRSWDARYFGPVPLTGIRGVLRPVMTW